MLVLVGHLHDRHPPWGASPSAATPINYEPNVDSSPTDLSPATNTPRYRTGAMVHPTRTIQVSPFSSSTPLLHSGQSWSTALTPAADLAPDELLYIYENGLGDAFPSTELI